MLARSGPGRRDGQGRLRDRPRERSGSAGARSAGSFSERAADRRRRGLRAARGQGGGLRRCPRARSRPPARHSRHCFPAAGMGRHPRHPSGIDRKLCRDRSADWRAEGGALGGAGVRIERACGGHSVSSGRAHGRPALGLPLGRCTQTGSAGAGGESMTRAQTAEREPASMPTARSLAISIEAIDWARVAADLDAHGCATTGRLLSAQQCAELAETYATDAPFRSRVVMARHGFGRGEYKYFAYPLPAPVAVLRAALYPPLAEIANRWNQAMAIDLRYPREHASYLARCREAGQAKPTPLLLQYGAGDYNCLHQDLYGEHVFPLQVTLLLSRPGEDFTGGEFVLTEQRPRMQSRAEIVPLAHGEAVIFPVHHRPVQGTRGSYRVNMRHGVSRLRSGHRHTLGIIFHDAK